MASGGAEIDGGVGIEHPRDLRDVRRFSHEAMATVYQVYAVHADVSTRRRPPRPRSISWIVSSAS